MHFKYDMIDAAIYSHIRYMGTFFLFVRVTVKVNKESAKWKSI